MKGKHKNKNYNRTCHKMANSVRLLGFKQIDELFSKGFKLYKHAICVIRLQISIFTKGASISWRHLYNKILEPERSWSLSFYIQIFDLLLYFIMTIEMFIEM